MPSTPALLPSPTSILTGARHDAVPPEAATTSPASSDAIGVQEHGAPQHDVGARVAHAFGERVQHGPFGPPERQSGAGAAPARSLLVLEPLHAEPRVLRVTHDIEQDLDVDPELMEVLARPRGRSQERRVGLARLVPFDGGEP